MTRKQLIWFLANRRRKRMAREEKEERADYAWSELEHISVSDISANKLTDAQVRGKYNFGIGDTREVEVGGVVHHVRLIGINHDNLSDGSGKAGLTFQLVELLPDLTVHWPTNTNGRGWIESLIRTERLPEVKKLLPPDLQGAIKSVNKLASNGTDRPEADRRVITTADELFLLAGVEIIGTSIGTGAGSLIWHAGEGERYEYWSGVPNDASGNEQRIKRRLGFENPNAWGLRSANRVSAADFCSVSSAGLIHITRANINTGISFAFCV